MNPTVNLTLAVEKELELEKQGLSRTRRYIGDVSQVTDTRWYQGGISQVAEARPGLDGMNQIAETKPCPEGRRSILARLFHLPGTRHQSACNG
jgi:hypothetical protein